MILDGKDASDYAQYATASLTQTVAVMPEGNVQLYHDIDPSKPITFFGRANSLGLAPYRVRGTFLTIDPARIRSLLYYHKDGVRTRAANINPLSYGSHHFKATIRTVFDGFSTQICYSGKEFEYDIDFVDAYSGMLPGAAFGLTTVSTYKQKPEAKNMRMLALAAGVTAVALAVSPVLKHLSENNSSPMAYKKAWMKAFD